jgi:hypothetical protein
MYKMKERRIKLTLLLHVFLLLSGLVIIIIVSISVSNYIYGVSIRANHRDANSITTSIQGEGNSAIQDVNNSTSDLNDNGIIIIGHNATPGVHFVGKVKLSSLPSSVPAASEGEQPHMMPFHSKNLTSFLAEKRQADLGLIKPSIKVPAIVPSNHSSVNQTK